jgi:hypothetical protein
MINGECSGTVFFSYSLIFLPLSVSYAIKDKITVHFICITYPLLYILYMYILRGIYKGM